MNNIVPVLGSGAFWSNQKEKNTTKLFHIKTFFISIKVAHNSEFLYISRIDYVLNNTQWAFDFVAQKDSYYTFFLFFFSKIAISFLAFSPFVFFFFRTILVLFTCFFSGSLFVLLIISICHFCIQKINILLFFHML